MEFNFYKARLKTSGKIPEQIKADYDGELGPAPSKEDVQSWIKVYDLISGIELIVMKSPITDGYVPASYDKKDDWKIRDFVYQAEQDPYFGTYINDREEFLEDWKSGDYSPMGSLTFSGDDIEIIEELKGEKSSH
ncbi:hypothetical protein ACW2QC_07600 [Virgibacillus sp. FSP13]